MHMTAASLLSLACTALLAQNIIFVLMLCSSDFFKAVNNKISGYIYGIGVIAFTTLASALAYPVNRLLLIPHHLEILTPFAFVFTLCLLEAILELVLMKFAPSFRKTLGKLLPASAFNCAVLGVVFINVQSGARGIVGAVFYGFCAGLGFVLAFFVITKAIERTQSSTPPAPFRGLPIALLTAGILSLGFMGFMNLQLPL